MVRVKELRREKGYSVSQLAKRSGISAMTVNDVEAKGYGSIEVLKRIADALEVEFEELVEEDIDLYADALDEAEGGGGEYRERVRVYQLYNYKGVKRMFSLERVNNANIYATSSVYYLPDGWNAIYDRGVCKGIRSESGEILRNFISVSSVPALAYDNGKRIVELEPMRV